MNESPLLTNAATSGLKNIAYIVLKNELKVTLAEGSSVKK